LRPSPAATPPRSATNIAPDLPDHSATAAKEPPDRYSRRMATWEDVRRIALSLPETTEESSRAMIQWRVKGKGFVWERPLRRADLAALGDSAPDGPILAAYVADVGEKAALIADNPEVYFTTPHFDGYAIILVRLDKIAIDELEELTVDAWLAKAPKRLAAEFRSR
ncbi:MmcQ/YjbR family DNA-binding protein, partial [Actinokineospora sp.]|uniref:MmcQ/YjbR family DNA-binding protein n=1 Tax=Actinokineospora sp. TaxID=1872133 RepID=UPI003D6B39EB